MVRAHMKQSSEDKKETPKKDLLPKKKTVTTGIWPCKMNGCNKQFAREADLKRHQRTTKLHSSPGFACPQCDATFTRTDALRRHQKSRHNGVVIEPQACETDPVRDGVNDAGPSSGSASRSGSPSAKGKERQTSNSSTALSQPTTGGPSRGPSSYYRQHTMTTSNVFITPPAVEGQYSQSTGLPTSATRLHQAKWPPPPHPPPQWGDGLVHQMGPVSYHQIPGPPQYFQPSPYYRPSLMPPHPQPPHRPQITADVATHHQLAQNEVSNGQPSRQDTRATRPETPAAEVIVDSSHSQSKPDTNERAISDTSNSTPQRTPAVPVIDPSLDKSANTSASSPNDTSFPHHHSSNGNDPDELSMQITQAAVKAVLESARLDSTSFGDSAETTGTPNGVAGEASVPTNGIHGDDVDAEGEADADEDEERLVTGQLAPTEQHVNHGYPASTSAFIRPEPMDHMMTEDGEPMLNPAELLTQESLASPPPS